MAHRLSTIDTPAIPKVPMMGTVGEFLLEPAQRLELWTPRLQGGCSTTELCRREVLEPKTGIEPAELRLRSGCSSVAAPWAHIHRTAPGAGIEPATARLTAACSTY